MREAPDRAAPAPASDAATHVVPAEASVIAAATEPSQEPEGNPKATGHLSCWDEAYNILSKESPGLVDEYEKLLSRVLLRGRLSIGPGLLPWILTCHIAKTQSPSAPNEYEDESDVDNQIPHHDSTARRKKMKDITELGLQYMEDKKVKTTLLGYEIIVQDVAAGTAKVVAHGIDFIKQAIKDVPYASIITAGISLILPLLTSPTAAEQAVQDWFTGVASQLRYYTAMETALAERPIY